MVFHDGLKLASKHEMELHICLKNAWINNPGKFFLKVFLKQYGHIQYGRHDNNSSLEVTDENGAIKIGPWLQQSLRVPCASFNDTLLAWKVPEANKIELQIELYGKDISEITSDVDDINSVLKGYGSLHLETQESFHLHKLRLHEDQSSNMRIFLKSIADVGGIRMNLGWISFSVCRKSLPQDEPEVHDTIESLSYATMPQSDMQAIKTNNRDPLEEENMVQNKDPVMKTTSPTKPKSISPNLINMEEKTMLAFKAEDYFPESDAVRRILPLYHKLLRSPPHGRSSVDSYRHIEEPKSQERNRNDIVLTNDGVQMEESNNKPVMDTDFEQKKKFLDSHVIGVLDYQTKELDRYRQAIKQMGDVVVELRKEISALEITNSQLRAKLYYNNDAYEEDSSTNDGVLKRRLLSKTEDIQYLKDKIQKLQNEIIKKNECEKEFLKLRKAHELQQSVLQDLQAKATKYRLLEQTCQDQEKVIEELEKVRADGTGHKLSSKFKKSKKVYFSDSFPKDDRSPYQSHEETQLVPIKSHSSNHKFQELDRYSRRFMDSDIEDRVTLLSKLEKAEGRIMALEHQIADSTRHWAREKSQLKIQLADGISDRSPFLRQLSPPPLPLNYRHAGDYDSYFTIPQRNFRTMPLGHRYHHL